VHRGVAALRARLERDREGWRGALLLLLAPERRPPLPPLVPVAGAIAMSVKKASIVFAVLVLVAGGWMAARAAATRTPGPRTEPAVAPAATHTPVRAAADAPAAAPEAPVAALRPIDRDLDLHGEVVRRDGSPVADARLTAVTYAWRRASRLNAAGYRIARTGPSTTSAPDGTFALRLTRGECVALRVSADGLAPVELAMRQPGERVRVVLDEGVSLRVTVTDGSAALAGAFVELSDDGQGSMTTWRRGTSDASGAARFESLSPGARVIVRCLMPGRARSSLEAVDLPQSGEAAVSVVLAEGRTLRGRVIDAESGAPVAGAIVGFSWDPERAVSTAADGTYSLRGLVERGDEMVTVRAEGFAAERAMPGARDVVDFALRRGFAATGRFVGPDGVAVAGALAAAVASPSENGGAVCLSTGFATSASDGTFRIADLDRALRHVLTVTAPRSGRLCVAIPAPAHGADADLGDVTLPAARSIAGRVLDAASQPALGVKVMASGPLGGDSSPPLWRTDERLTDDLGRFRFGDLAPGRYLVIASPAGAPRVEASVDVPADRDVLDLVLGQTATRTLVVRVLDDAGRPVERALVDASGRNGERYVRAETSADGTARLAVAAGVSVAHAYAPYRSTLAFLQCEAQPLRADTTEVSFVLREGVWLTGRLLDVEGRPIARALVRVFDRPEHDVTVSTAEDGRFKAAVPRGAACDVRFDGIVSGRDTDLSARAEAASPGADVVLRCGRVATDRTLRVRVTDPNGKPVAGVRVFLGGDYHETMRSGDTDAEGRASFSGLAARAWIATAGSHGGWYQSAPLAVTPDGQEVTLTLRAAATISGVVVGKDGRGVRAVAAAWSDADEWFFVSDVTADDGTFTLRVSAEDPGPFRVTARFTDSAPGTHDVEVGGVAPGAADVRLVLPK
jgi:protocatechuate 3,4-dioxygenase beta subunit